MKTAKGDCFQRALKFPMTANKTTAMTATGDRPAFDFRQRVASASGWRDGVDLPAGLLLAGRRRASPENAQGNCPGQTRRKNLPTPIASIAISIPTPPASSTGKPNRWFSRRTPFAKSVHARLACVDCHTGVKELVHDSPLPPPDCTRCHEKEAKEYATSIHGVSHMLGASGAAQLLGLPRLARHSAGQGPGLAGVQNEPAAAPARSATATPA